MSGSIFTCGRRLGPGDFVHADADTDHGELWTEEGAQVILVVPPEEHLPPEHAGLTRRCSRTISSGASAVGLIVGVHDQLAEQAPAYVLGALTPAERPGVRGASGGVCRLRGRGAQPDTGRRRAGPRARRPAATRRAGSSPVFSTRSRAPLGPLHAAGSRSAASMALVVGLGVAIAAQLRGRVTGLEARLRDAHSARRSRRAPDGRTCGAPLPTHSRRWRCSPRPTWRASISPVSRSAPHASARAFWSRSRGLVFTASNLPAPPPGRAYQLWVLTAQPAPISAGMLDAGRERPRQRACSTRRSICRVRWRWRSRSSPRAACRRRPATNISSALRLEPEFTTTYNARTRGTRRAQRYSAFSAGSAVIVVAHRRRSRRSASSTAL